MKLTVLASAMLAVILFAVPAKAAWMDSVNSAIASGNMTQINLVAANNPGVQGELALYLLQKSHDMFDKNPELAGKIFVTAQAFVAQIPAEKTKSAADMILSVESRAKEKMAQQKDCRGAVTVLGAALNMSSLPNIVAAAPNMHANMLADANDSIEKNPQCDTKELEDQVSLAQQPLTPNVPRPPRPVPSAD